MEPLNERQGYLTELAMIIEEEGLAPEQVTQLMLGEIASWLMVIARTLENTPENGIRGR